MDELCFIYTKWPTLRTRMTLSTGMTNFGRKLNKFKFEVRNLHVIQHHQGHQRDPLPGPSCVLSSQPAKYCSRMSYGYVRPCLKMARTGWCPMGGACQWADSHDLELDELKRRSVCFKFKSGLHCPWGDTCFWLHETRMCIDCSTLIRLIDESFGVLESKLLFSWQWKSILPCMI